MRNADRAARRHVGRTLRRAVGLAIRTAVPFGLPIPSPSEPDVHASADSSAADHPTPVVGVVMGSASDFDTLAPACEILAELGIPYEARKAWPARALPAPLGA